MTKKSCAAYAPTLLRVLVGVLFLVQGVRKLMNPGGPAGMLENFGFPLPVVFAWILLLSEIIFGAAVLSGWKVKYTVWPLVIVMIVAILTPAVEGFVPIMYHLIIVGALVSVYLTGPGKYAFE